MTNTVIDRTVLLKFNIYVYYNVLYTV